MKKIVLFLSIVLVSVSCKKSGADGSTVRYEFNSDVSANYMLEYSSDVSTLQTETFQGTT